MFSTGLTEEEDRILDEFFKKNPGVLLDLGNLPEDDSDEIYNELCKSFSNHINRIIIDVLNNNEGAGKL